MQKFQKFIKKYDQFRNYIQFHFDELGDPYKTFFGRVVTIIYTLFMLAYFSFCVYKMTAHLSDTDITLVSSTNL